ncbi:hypothetical protein ACJ73_00971 [Blastomyces percursus]|uniref:Uncharacterized protein n=1 Tax=Blastomyces percursus TaxID=1658174 RepID=A0A1J9QFM8_9EURO|nr:hypothetical protein ACJ73_00971 [Blastomyces percursus]
MLPKPNPQEGPYLGTRSRSISRRFDPTVEDDAGSDIERRTRYDSPEPVDPCNPLSPQTVLKNQPSYEAKLKQRMARDASEFTSDAGAGSPSDAPVLLPPNPSVFTSTLQNLKASGVGQEEAFKFAMARWRAVFGAQNAQTVPTANPSMPAPASTSAFRDFKDDFGHVDMKMNNKLAGTTNYDNDPQTLVQSKLERIDQDGSTRMGNASALWDALELEYQVHWADLQAQLFSKLAAINIDQYERDITKYVRAWRQIVNQINVHNWNSMNDFYAQRFIDGLGTYSQSYVQSQLEALRQGRPKTEVPVINLEELIDDLVRYKTVVKGGGKEEKNEKVLQAEDDKKDSSKSSSPVRDLPVARPPSVPSAEDRVTLPIDAGSRIEGLGQSKC